MITSDNILVQARGQTFRGIIKPKMYFVVDNITKIINLYKTFLYIIVAFEFTVNY